MAVFSVLFAVVLAILGPSPRNERSKEIPLANPPKSIFFSRKAKVRPPVHLQNADVNVFLRLL